MGHFTVEIGDGSRGRRLTFGSDQIESIRFDAVPATQLARDTVRTVSTDNRPQPNRTVTPAANSRVVVTDSIPAPRQQTQANRPVLNGAPRTTPQVIKVEDSTPAVANTPAPVKTAPVKASTVALKPSATTAPVSVAVKVLADNTSNGWTNSGFVVKKGQKVHITGDGQISLGNGQKTEASGRYDLEDTGKLLKSVPTGALIAVIGDDNNDFIYVGSEREFTAARDGALFLGVNEGNLNDNTGSFDVKIEIDPNGGE